MVRLTSIGASPTEGSSTSRIFGASISARAERQHLLLAAAHAAGELRAALGEARKGLEADVEIAGELAARGCGAKAPSSRFSSTVSLGNSRRPSGTSAMPRSTISSVVRPTRS